MDHLKIEERAQSLLVDVWRDRRCLFPDLEPTVWQVVNPETIARYLGYEIRFANSLGRWGRGDANFEIAGLLDQQQHVVGIATADPHTYESSRFTLGHELMHVALGHPGRMVHRDRPMFDLDLRQSRDPIEQEADYGSACLLAPRRLLEKEFRARFQIGPPLPLSDDVIFNLCGESGHALMRSGDTMRFAIAVATTSRFSGRHFRPLTDTFGMSRRAMAIRLRETGLVAQ